MDHDVGFVDKSMTCMHGSCLFTFHPSYFCGHFVFSLSSIMKSLQFNTSWGVYEHDLFLIYSLFFLNMFPDIVFMVLYTITVNIVDGPKVLQNF
jgi:hypothetical protein